MKEIKIVPVLKTKSQISRGLMELVIRQCRSACRSGSCTSKVAKLAYTEACRCMAEGCERLIIPLHDTDSKSEKY